MKWGCQVCQWWNWGHWFWLHTYFLVHSSQFKRQHPMYNSFWRGMAFSLHLPLLTHQHINYNSNTAALQVSTTAVGGLGDIQQLTPKILINILWLFSYQPESVFYRWPYPQVWILQCSFLCSAGCCACVHTPQRKSGRCRDPCAESPASASTQLHLFSVEALCGQPV